MPSEKHDALLGAVCAFADERYRVQEGEWLVRVDAPDTEKPMSVEGFRPDFSARRKDFCILGEAKTARDLASLRSNEQIAAYIRYLARFSDEVGRKTTTKRRAVLILAVPLASMGLARLMLSRADGAGRIRWHAIDQTGWDSTEGDS